MTCVFLFAKRNLLKNDGDGVRALTLGLIVLLCSLVLTLLGVAVPLLEPLRVSSVWAALFLMMMLGAWYLIPKEAALLTAAVGAGYLIRLRWGRGRLMALLAAFAGGLCAFLVLLAVDSFREAGMIAGLCSAVFATALGKFRRGRLFAGFAAPLFTMAFAGLAEWTMAIVLYGGESAFFDLTVGSSILTAAMTGTMELIKSRRLE